MGKRTKMHNKIGTRSGSKNYAFNCIFDKNVNILNTPSRRVSHRNSSCLLSQNNM